MTLASWGTAFLLGLLLGVRHALDPDHLAAIAVLVARRGRSGAGTILGAVWGLGHTLSLFVVGCVLAAIDARLPPRLADGFELLVAAMLVTLGVRAILRARAPANPPRHDLAPDSRWSLVRQPLVVGLIHGLAGSGALTALALASLPSVWARLVYILLFGAGSVAGMACLTGLAGWPLGRLDASGKVSRALSWATGILSTALGVAWGCAALVALMRA